MAIPTYSARAELPEDRPTVRAITIAAFGRQDEAELVDALREDPSWIEGLSVVSTTPAGDVVGHALLTRCHVDDVPALCLAPCSVLPGHQRSGAGSSAIRGALDAARARGEEFVVVLGHPTYYPRFGFRPAADAGIGLTVEVPADALMALALDPAGALPSGTVRYAAPFGI